MRPSAARDTDDKLARSARSTMRSRRSSASIPAVLDERFRALEQTVAGVKLVGEVSPRVHARVLATGELAATELGAAYLRCERARRRLARHPRVPRERDDPRPDRAGALPFGALRFFGRQGVCRNASRRLEGVVLSQGFIARNAQGETVLLGRGGSDTSGAYLAGKLEARRLEIWTDAPGFFSADPKAVPSARLIKTLHYREAQEIASAGGGILHPRSISPVRASGIPLFLKCTTHPEWEGSVISNAQGDDEPQLKAISHRSGITLVSMESMEMWHQVGFLADAFNVLPRARLVGRPDLDVGEQRHRVDRLGAERHGSRRDRSARRRSAQAVQGQRHRRLRRHHARRPTHPHDPPRARPGARGLSGAAGPPRDAGGERLEPHVRRELRARVQARAAPARACSSNKFEGGVFGATWEQLTGGGAPREDSAEAVVGQEEGAAARDRRGSATPPTSTTARASSKAIDVAAGAASPSMPCSTR